MRILLLLVTILAPLAACAVESPFSVHGKPKLAGPRCPPASAGCPDDLQP